MVEQWIKKHKKNIKQIKRCFISHQVTTCKETQNKTNNITLKWLFMIGFHIELFVDRFLGYFSSFNICQLNIKVIVKHTQISTESQFEMHSWYMIAQWPRCSNNKTEGKKKKPNQNGGYAQTSSQFMHTKVTRPKCENMHNCISGIFIIHFPPIFLDIWTFYISPEYKLYFKVFNTG